MTYDTDGAQAEVDRQPNNVNRFSLFFPRKRPFFLVWVARARLEPCPTEPGRRPRHQLRLAISLALTLLCSLLVHARANQGGVLELVATLEGRAGGVVVAGHYAYVSSGATLRIIDVSDPSQPAEVGTFTVPERIYGFDVTAEHVYIAGGLAGLHILDVSDAATPRLLATHQTPGQAMSVAAREPMALVVNLMSGLEVLDISDPSAPTVIVTQDTPGYQQNVTLAGSVAVVVDQPSGVFLFELADPTAPTSAGTLPPDRMPAGTLPLGWMPAWTAMLADGRLYVVNGSGLLEIVDISDPGGPRLLGSYDSPGRPQRVAVTGSTVYLADGRAGLQVVDVSDPANATVIGTYDTPGAARDVAVDGSLVFVADGSALVILRHRR